MADNESIEAYMLRVNEIVNAIRALGETLKESAVVKKVLRSLPARYDAKVSAIEEIKDLDTLSLDEMHGSLTAYEMRIGKGESHSEKEAAFKALKKLKIKQESEEEDSEDELIANLTRRLIQSKSTHKGKLPFKCFNCGRIGHFASKCPEKRKQTDDDDSDEDEQESSRYRRNKQKFIPRKGKSKKKILLSKREMSSSNEEDDDSSDELLFMVFKDKTPKDKSSASKDVEEAEIDYEGELCSALDDLLDERKKSRKLKKQLGETGEIILQLQVTIEESKRMNEDLMTSLSSKSDECTSLEEQVIRLSAELEELKKSNEVIATPQSVTILRPSNKSVSTQTDYSHALEETGTNILDEILSYQRQPSIKSGLGFEHDQSSKTVNNKGKSMANNPIRFVKEKFHSSQTGRRAANNKPDRDSFTQATWQRQHVKARYGFSGYCYSCNGYGHRMAECRRNVRPVSYFSRNSFSPLMDEPVECYRCQNFGHIAKYCRTIFPSQQQYRGRRGNKQARQNSASGSSSGSGRITEKKQKRKPRHLTVADKAVWVEKKKITASTSDSMLVQTTLKAQNRPSPWILDSGCSSHMTGDKDMFDCLEHIEGGSVRFGNNDGAIIEGSGTVKLNNGKIKSNNVLYVSGLKHNLLSVSRICDRGHEVLFRKDGCEIRRVKNGKVIALGSRTAKNLYTLSESVDDTCSRETLGALTPRAQ